MSLFIWCCVESVESKPKIETQIILSTHRHFPNTLGFFETVGAAVRIMLCLSRKKDTW